MKKGNNVFRTTVLAASFLPLLASSVSAQELKLSTQREFWTADQLYDDFLADFGGDTKPCYTNYQLKQPPPMPDGPETAGRHWKKAIVAIDASGSMAGRVGGERKMDAAKAAVNTFLSKVPEDAEVGLLAFGHEGSNDEKGKALSCKGVELISPLGPVNPAKLSDALKQVKATGWTPLAAAITKAGASFTAASGEGEQVVFVVSDGLETCGGDPVAAAKALHESNVKAVVNIIGFNIPQKDRQALKAVADAGGGAFSEAANRKELEEKLKVETANLQEKLAYDQLALQAKNENNTAALTAANRANTCVFTIVNNESTKFLQLTNRMADNGQTDAESKREAYQRLRERHDKLKAEQAQFGTRAKAEMNAINDRIQADRERVDASYSKK